MSDRAAAPVSVVIPFYRGAATIARAVASLEEQTLPPGEIVIVNDGPPDRVPTVPARTPVRVIEHERNRGIPAARNSGVRAASQPWIGFLDQDDEWPRDRLERQMRVAHETRGDVAIFGRLYHMGQGRKPWLWPPASATAPLERGDDDAVRALIRWGNALPFVTLLLPRDLLLRLPLDERLLGGADDYEYVLRLVAEGVPFRYDGGGPRGYSAIHHFTGSNYSAHAPRWLEDDLRLLDDLARRYPLICARRDEAVAQVHYTFGRYHDRAGELDSARAHYVAALLLDRSLLKPRLALLRLRLPTFLRRLIERLWEAIGL